jgi:hypothetical protein
VIRLEALLDLAIGRGGLTKPALKIGATDGDRVPVVQVAEPVTEDLVNALHRCRRRQW